MKIRYHDGVVREFSRAISDGDRLPDGTRANCFQNGIEASCTHCGEQFGVHSLVYLKPVFKNHQCKEGRNAKEQ